MIKAKIKIKPWNESVQHINSFQDCITTMA
jgi:hypothetical protein